MYCILHLHVYSWIRNARTLRYGGFLGHSGQMKTVQKSVFHIWLTLIHDMTLWERDLQWLLVWESRLNLALDDIPSPILGTWTKQWMVMEAEILYAKKMTTYLGQKFMTANEMRQQAFRKQWAKKKRFKALNLTTWVNSIIVYS